MEDYYTYVVETIANSKDGSCFFMCNGDYAYLNDVDAGNQKLRDEGYITRSSGCDIEWIKEK